MGMKLDLGVVGTLSGAAILSASYVALAPLAMGRPDTVRYTLKAVTKSGTNITGLLVQVQFSDDTTDGTDGTWTTVQSQLDDLTPETEHTFTLSDGSTAFFPFTVGGGFRWLRLYVKATGGIGATGDVMTFRAEAV